MSIQNENDQKRSITADAWFNNFGAVPSVSHVFLWCRYFIQNPNVATVELYGVGLPAKSTVL